MIEIIDKNVNSFFIAKFEFVLKKFVLRRVNNGFSIGQTYTPNRTDIANKIPIIWLPWHNCDNLAPLGGGNRWHWPGDGILCAWTRQSRFGFRIGSTDTDLLKESNRHIGKRYVHGGKGLNQFDCSGFTSYVPTIRLFHKPSSPGHNIRKGSR